MNEPVLGGDSAERQKLTDALDTIVELLVEGKLEVVRSSITEMESELSRRIASASEKSTEAVDRVTKDLTSRVDTLLARLDEIEERQNTTLAKLEERAKESSTDLERQLKETVSATDDRVRSVQEELAKNFADKEEKLNREWDALAAQVARIENDFEEQTRATGRISTLLHGLETVFSGPRPPQTTIQVAEAVQTVRDDEQVIPLATDPREGPGPKEETVEQAASATPGEDLLDSALDRVFRRT